MTDNIAEEKINEFLFPRWKCVKDATIPSIASMLLAELEKLGYHWHTGKCPFCGR